MEGLYGTNYISTQEPAQPPETTETEQKKDRRVPNLITGIAVVLLAAFGAYQLVSIGVGYYKRVREEKAQAKTAEYYSYLIPAAAIDISPFDDITVADMSELVEMSVWSVLNSGLDPTQYVYEDDMLLLPQTQVESAFVHYFGTEKSIVHVTVSGYGYEFTYDASAKVYRIPLTTITPLYTPVIVSTETKGDAVTLRVGYRNAGLYSKDPVTGTLTAPEPDKYVSVTLRTASTGTYISAVRSEDMPDNAAGNTVPSVTAAPEETSSAPAETATAGDETSETGTGEG